VPNDAKLGLALGVGLFVAIAMVFRKDEAALPAVEKPAPALIQPASRPAVAAPQAPPLAAEAQPASLDKEQGEQAK
jgi:hypothetical protein